jgi:hypothetical protein
MALAVETMARVSDHLDHSGEKAASLSKRPELAGASGRYEDLFRETGSVASRACRGYSLFLFLCSGLGGGGAWDEEKQHVGICHDTQDRVAFEGDDRRDHRPMRAPAQL